MSVNFTKNQDEITSAWRRIVDSPDISNWALFGYEGSTNVIKLISTGSQGLEELVQEFNCSLIQYAFCRVIDQELSLNKLVLINWQGETAPLSRKGLCASHVSDVSNYFKGCTQTITIRNDDEATKEHLLGQIAKTSASKINLSRHQNSTNPSATNDSNVDNSISSYKRVDLSSELTANRKSFWKRQEEEEKERLAEEKRRAAEKHAQFERERKQREEHEAKKLAETIKERDRLIEANKQAERASQAQRAQVSSTTVDDKDDDGRVGRRSELIRLERNQETQSIITKGSIKNKRAIFEQAQQQQSQQPTLTRRSSGAITQRANAFKSLNSNNTTVSSTVGTNNSQTSNNVVQKLASSFTEQVNIVSGDEVQKISTPNAIKKEVQPVTLMPEPDLTPVRNIDEHLSRVAPSSPSPSPKPQRIENGDISSDIGQDVNGNSESSFSDKSQANETVANSTSTLITNEDLIMNGKNSNIQAMALYDYQAADNTEISFDPDDKIGHIQKVDPGWWHGQVTSGRFKGQIGLFPANYVEELESS